MMKKILFLALGICLLAFTAHAVIVGRSGPPSGEDYSDITFWLNFEEGDVTGDYDMGSSECSDGDTSGAYNGEATVNGDVTIIGSYTLDVPSSNDYMAFDVSSDDIVSGTTGRIGLYIYINTYGNYGPIWRIDTATSDYARLQLYTSGTYELRLTWDDGTAEHTVTSGANLQLSTVYFVEVEYDASQDAGSDIVKIYVNGTERASASNLTMSPITGNSLKLGESGAVTVNYAIDNVMISTDPDRDFYGGGTGLCDDTSKPSGSCNG